MNIDNVLRRLHDSEINCSVSSLDGGWDVRLGDQVNGFVAAGVTVQVVDAVLSSDAMGSALRCDRMAVTR